MSELAHRKSAWIYVILTCFFELSWVLGFQLATEFWHWILILILIFIDFTCLTKACKSIPTGTVYAIFASAGAIGTTLMDALFFGTTIKFSQIIFILLIVIGVVLLKCADNCSNSER
ncbi:SMR family transporter [Orbaceae bacterium ESL0721]|nr:SMR family transporter [Orbaceae bacterium ESL0721]